MPKYEPTLDELDEAWYLINERMDWYWEETEPRKHMLSFEACYRKGARHLSNAKNSDHGKTLLKNMLEAPKAYFEKGLNPRFNEVNVFGAYAAAIQLNNDYQAGGIQTGKPKTEPLAFLGQDDVGTLQIRINTLNYNPYTIN